ncbi:MAG: hypothetical protein AVDCRST_MAG68-2154 [uncultured Gemmatimonadetes bacterium]|uniref:Uncharacterized protein n=1 Tax=uncultured Gemmatimonadota bacterium TaxID=203437 RepID=A0A6J4L7B4_9BACT|nr:MAG: hypothetical protein AVDCRST_MAG68-2154 [uncultured Gemmatimonadota bacterium]
MRPRALRQDWGHLACHPPHTRRLRVPAPAHASSVSLCLCVSV